MRKVPPLAPSHTTVPKRTYRLNLDDPQNAHVVGCESAEAAQALAVRVLSEFAATIRMIVTSPEFAAREELRAQLEALKQNDVIRRSESCVSLLDALSECVNLSGARTDVASLIEPLAPHFKSESNRKTAIRRGEATAAADAKYRAHLDAMSASAKPNQRITSLKNTFGLTRPDAYAIHRRWRDAQKRRTSAGSRQE